MEYYFIELVTIMVQVSYRHVQIDLDKVKIKNESLKSGITFTLMMTKNTSHILQTIVLRHFLNI